MTKIKNFNIVGLRGIKDCLSLNLDKQSALLYGDNGTGKSSITDAFEWFYNGSIAHLSNEEIDRKGGITALRNIFLTGEDGAHFKVSFTKNNLDNTKTISDNNGKLNVNSSNTSVGFNIYLDDSNKENLILRYGDLISFINASKTDKLKELSKIIGFGEVAHTRNLLKKTVNKLKDELKMKNYDSRINTQQSHLIEQIEQNIISDEQYINTIKELFVPLKISKSINNASDINEALELIGKPEETQHVDLQSFYSDTQDSISHLLKLSEDIDDYYKDYFIRYNNLIKDLDKIKNIILENLLSEGVKILRGDIYVNDTCPLCLTPMGRHDLISELEKRISELEKFKSEETNLIDARDLLEKLLNECLQRLSTIRSKEHYELEENKSIKSYIENIINSFNEYRSQLKIDLITPEKIIESARLKVGEKLFSHSLEICKNKLKDLKEERTSTRTQSFEIHSKVVLVRKAYQEIKRLEKEKKILENQHKSMELIFNDLVLRQKKGLESFLDSFSSEIDDLYRFMNPNQKVKNIKLTKMESEEELKGLTIQLKFFDSDVSPPLKYLSESQLNCLGISFFLTSVKAFNKSNKFIILDDIISSFDTAHRIRFAQLLIEKFNDYQIILLTHEKDWFDYVSHAVKGKNWIIERIQWNDKKGTYIEESCDDLVNRIENKISQKKEESLGNDIRKYLEHILKNIAHELEVKVNFLFNDRNENRMSFELLTELLHKLKKQPSSTLKDSKVSDRLLRSLFLGNKDSHDSSFTSSFEDFCAFWEDVKELDKICECSNCQKYISMEYYDSVNKKIRCRCGNLTYDWEN